MSTPSAKARTLSLFTGQTGLETGASSRDGSPPGAPSRPRKRKRKGSWFPSGPHWVYLTQDGSNGAVLAELRPHGARWEVRVRGESRGVHATMAAAALAAERDLGDA